MSSCTRQACQNHFLSSQVVGLFLFLQLFRYQHTERRHQRKATGRTFHVEKETCLSWSLIFPQPLPIVAKYHRTVVHHLTFAVSFHELDELRGRLCLKGHLLSVLLSKQSFAKFGPISEIYRLFVVDSTSVVYRGEF